MKVNLSKAVLISVGFIFFAGCNQTERAGKKQFSELALKGKEVFEKYECNACHYLGDEEVVMEGPDLTDPFIANNSLFVKAHLKFVKETKMPPIELSDDEIVLLSHYVGELHRVKYPSIGEEEADARCPVCYAPVARKQAKTKKLTGTFLREKYYFECQDCLDLFTKYPVAFRELFRQYQDGNDGSATSLK